MREVFSPEFEDYLTQYAGQIVVYHVEWPELGDYIGSTKDYRTRLRQHKSTRGLGFFAQVLAICADLTEARIVEEREIRARIPSLNGTLNGQLNGRATARKKAKYVARWTTEEYREKMEPRNLATGLRTKELWKDPEYAAKFTRPLGYRHTDEARAAMRANAKRGPLSDAHRAALSAGSKLRWARPEERDKMRASTSARTTPESRASHGLKMKAAWERNRSQMTSAIRAAPWTQKKGT